MGHTVGRRPGRKRAFRGHIPGISMRGPKVDPRALSAEQPHRRHLPPDMRLSEKAETPFGCLNLMGAISNEQFEAGQRYRSIVAEYCSSIGAPLGGFPQGRGYPCKGEPQCGLVDGAPPCECRRRKIAYDQAFEALAEVGHRAQVEVAHVAVHGRKCGELAVLLRGLDALVRHLLTDRRKNGRQNVMCR